MIVRVNSIEQVTSFTMLARLEWLSKVQNANVSGSVFDNLLLYTVRLEDWREVLNVQRANTKLEDLVEKSCVNLFTLFCDAEAIS